MNEDNAMNEKSIFKNFPFWKLLQYEHNIFHIKRHLFSMLRHFTLRKLINLLLVEAQRRLKIVSIKGYPPLLKVEPTNYCNLKCPGCFTGTGVDKRQKGYMDIDLYKKTIDEVGKYLIKINLYLGGEPFLYPHLFDMVSYASQKNIGTCISTNLLVFSKEKAEKILDCGLDHLIICFDGADRKTYESYRKGGSHSAFVENMKMLSEIRREKKLFSTFIEVQFIVFDYNVDQIDKAKELVKPYGFDRFTMKMDAEQNRPYDPAMFRSNVPCYWLWLVPTVCWDGSVTPCCEMPPTSFGNLNNQTLKEIWNGDKYIEARKLYKKGTLEKSKSVCSFCHRGPNEAYKRELAKRGYRGPREYFLLDKKPWEN